MRKIKVRVIKMTGRSSLVAEWRDPLSGKLKRRATGEKQRREAERFAVRLEKQLNDGDYIEQATTWDDFRETYEAAHRDKWAKNTKTKVSSVFSTVERILKPRFVQAIDSAAVVRFVAQLAKDRISPAGIGGILRHLKAALRWGHRKNLLPRVPDIEMPQGAIKAGGRAVTTEEFERMLATVPKALEELRGRPAEAGDVASWRTFLQLLWTSGLRVGEAHKLHWTDGRDIAPEMDGKFPMFRIASQASKNRKAQRFPMSPEAFALLSGTSRRGREGFVSNPTFGGVRVGQDTAIRTVSMIGQKAGIVVERTQAGEPVYASAHDLRRSCATRWAAKVTPGVLQAMMRHASPTTTAKFYTDLSGDPIAAAVWEAMGPKAPAVATGTIKTTITESEETARTRSE